MNFFIRIIIFLALTGTICQADGQDRVIRLTSSEYVPYFGKNLKDNGVIAQIVTQSFKKTGYRTEIEFFPWVRAEALAKIGRYHGMVALWYNDKRVKWFVYSEPIPPANELVYFKKKDRVITDRSDLDLKHLIVGYVHGYAYSDDITGAGLKQKSYTDEENIQLLISGKIDLALTDRLQAEYIINRMHPGLLDAFDSLMPPLRVNRQYLVISRLLPDAGQIIADFNQGLEQIRMEGLLEEILKAHGF